MRTALVLVVVTITIVALVSALRGGTARDPGDLAVRFPEAGITCRDLDVIVLGASASAYVCP